jgi:translation initiation factor 4E
VPESSNADAVEDKVEELIPGLHAWLEELRLSSKYHEGISKWAEENGAVTLEEVIENKEELCKVLELRLLEKSRFSKKGEEALAAIREKGLARGSNGSSPSKVVETKKVESKEPKGEEPKGEPIREAVRSSKNEQPGKRESMPEYLSFNNGISQMDSYKPAVDSGERQSQDPKLDDTWWFWQQVSLSKTDKNADYAGATAKVLSFDSMKSFWGFWNHLPQPSTLLEGKKFLRKNDDDRSIVEAFMIFRDGVKPEWEDPLNASGGHFQIQLRPDLGGGQIDEYWNNIVMFMVMNQIEPVGMITGVRLVDKLIVKGKKFDNAVIRIEVWFADFDQTEKVEQLKRSLERCMSTRLNGTRAVSIPHIDVKSHSSKK